MKILQNKISIKIGLALAFVAILIVFAFRGFDEKKLHDVISQTLNQSFGVQLISIGHIETSLIQRQASIYDIKIKHKKMADSKDTNSIQDIKRIDVITKFSLSSLIGSPKIQEIIIHQPHFTLGQLEETLHSITADTPKISISEGTLDLWNIQMGISSKISEVNLSLEAMGENMKASGGLNIGPQYYRTSATLNTSAGKNEKQLMVQMISTTNTLELRGSVYNNNINGNIKVTGKNLFEVINTVLFKGKTRRLQTTNAQSQGEFSINFDIQSNDKVFNIDNLIVESADLSGKGLISQTEKEGLYVELDIENINLDIMATHDLIRGKDMIQNFQTRVPKDFIALAEIRIGRALIWDYTISDVHFHIDASQGKLRIFPLIANLDRNTQLRISGELSDNEIRPRLKGEVEIHSSEMNFSTKKILPVKLGNKLDFSSEFDATTGNIILRNIKIETDETTLDGLIKIKIGPYNRAISGRLDIDRLRYDHENDLSKHYSKINLISLPWLRSIKFHTDLQINIKELLIKNNLINKAIFAIDISNSELRINPIALHSKDIDILGKVLFSAKDVYPRFFVDLKSKQFNYDILSPPQRSTELKWSQQNWNLDAFENFNGTLAIHAKNFTKQGITFQEIDLQGQMQNDLLRIKSLKGRLYDGEFDAQANIGMTQDPSFNVIFTVNNIHIEELLKNIMDIHNIQGYGSFSGNLVSKGKNMKEWASNINGVLNMAMRNIRINNFNISWVADNILRTRNYSELINVLETARYTGETILSNVDGTTNLQDGKASMSLKYRNDRISGASMFNFATAKFIMSGVSRFLFVPLGHAKGEVISADLKIKGPINRPESSFDAAALNKFLFLGEGTVAE